jgi:hypothetical protein
VSENAFWGNSIKHFIVRRVDIIVHSKDCSVGKAVCVLHNWLSQNSAVGLPYITDGMAVIEVWEEGKPYFCS